MGAVSLLPDRPNVSSGVIRVLEFDESVCDLSMTLDFLERAHVEA